MTNKEMSEIVTNDVKEDPGVGVGVNDDQDVGVEASGAVTNDENVNGQEEPGGGVGDDQDDGVGVRKNCYEMKYMTDGGEGWIEAVTEDAQEDKEVGVGVDLEFGVDGDVGYVGGGVKKDCDERKSVTNGICGGVRL